MSPEARGCWIDALCFLNEHGGYVTWPIDAFARFWGVSEGSARDILDSITIANVGNVLWQTDSKTVATLSNRRMLREIAKRQEIKEKRTKAGKKGAANRWQKWHSSESSSSSLNLKESSKKKILVPPPEEAIECSQLLSDLIFENFPNRTAPTEPQLMSWARDAERLNRIDNHPWAEIAELIRWAQADDFWKANILSMSKLREKWNQLVAKKESANGRSRQAEPKGYAAIRQILKNHA